MSARRGRSAEEVRAEVESIRAAMAVGVESASERGNDRVFWLSEFAYTGLLSEAVATGMSSASLFRAKAARLGRATSPEIGWSDKPLTRRFSVAIGGPLLTGMEALCKRLEVRREMLGEMVALACVAVGARCSRREVAV